MSSAAEPGQTKFMNINLKIIQIRITNEISITRIKSLKSVGI